MSNALTRRAKFCHDQVLAGKYEDTMAWFNDLAGHLQTSPRQARRAWGALGLGRINATTEAASSLWVADPAGRSLLTLPICRQRLSDPDVNVFELLALDPGNPASFFIQTNDAAALGYFVLHRARSQIEGITLYATPLDYLRGWCRYWAEQDQILDEKPAGTDTQMGPDRGLYSPHFPGVCLLGYNRPLLPIFRNVGDITIENEAFAHRFSAKIEAEIELEISKRKYPRILLKQQEAAA